MSQAGWRDHRALDFKLKAKKGLVIKQQPSKTRSIEKEGTELSLDKGKDSWDGHRHPFLRARGRGGNGRWR